MRAALALASAVACLSLLSPAQAQQPGYNQPYNPGNQPYNPNQPGGARPGQPAGNQPYNPSAKQPNHTENNLRRAEELDSGRGLEWFYVGAEGGVFWLGADALSKSGGPLLTGDRKASGVGPGGGLFVGGRVYTLTAGARVRTAWLPDSQFLSAGAEVGLHIPKGKLEPHFWLGGGYATLLGVGESVRGFDVVLGGGADYYISNNFSVGGLASIELISLGRGAYQGSPKASTTGLAAVGSVVLGLHF